VPLLALLLRRLLLVAALRARRLLEPALVVYAPVDGLQLLRDGLRRDGLGRAQWRRLQRPPWWLRAE